MIGIEIILLAVTTGLLLLVASFRLKFTLTSPVYGLVGFYFAICVFGYYAYIGSISYYDTFYDINVTPSDMLRTIPLIMFEGLFFSLGAMFRTVLINKTSTYTAVDRNKIAVTNKPSKRLKRIGLLFVGFVPLIIMVSGIGFDNLLQRSTYLIYNYQILKGVGTTFSIVAIPFLGYFLFEKDRTKITIILCTGLFIAYELIFFAMASRRFVVAPMLFALGAVIGRPRSKSAILFLIGSILVAPWLLQFPLMLRNLSQQGLIPFFNILVGSGKQPNRIFGYEYAFQRFILNIFFSLPLATYIKIHPDAVKNTLFVSLNPLPGALVNWTQIYEKLRVTVNMPFNAVGEVIAHGILFLGMFYTFLGIFFTSNELYAKRQLRRGSLTRALIVLGLLYLTILVSTEYQLRVVMRLVYYIVLIRMAFWFFDIVKNEFSHKKL